ncbi:MAG: transglycosylase domain-containing protein [Actinobacteria bacterium]|nr:transglycosylase domain-containing protein [Actinomycetota bacterium]
MAVSLLKRRRNSDGGDIPPAPPAVPLSPAAPGPPKRTKPRLKKLRFLFVLLGLGILAVISMVFGMMAAVSQDLPAIYNFAQYKAQKNSEVVDSSGRVIGTLSSDQNKILLSPAQISPNIKNAVVAIEDARFYEHDGVDFRGIARALVSDVLSGSAQQGASTITEQFVKNALEAEGSRTILEKFREAALAYKLEKHWSKEKILTEYLNTIYFGEGAYGIESAAQTYFGAAHPGCGGEAEPCAALLEPWEAAMVAGIIASPSAFDPKVNPEAALSRRNLVLEKMFQQGYITHQQYQEGIHKALPAPSDIKPPTLQSKAPYFTAFLRQQLVERYGAEKAYFGGLEVHATLDLQLQEAAEEAVNSYLGYSPATASVVVIDNHTGGIKAMVGGPNFEKAPFNLATQGRRQPGSSIKPFTLLTALEEGISPETEFPSEQRTFHFGKKGGETFVVHNDEEGYLGSCSIACGLTYSDNSIYAALALEGLKGKTIEDRTRSIAKTIHKAGYTDPISTNPAMALGGLQEGVSPLMWAYAYSTIGNNGDRISGTLAPRPGDSPLTFTEVTKGGKPIKGGENKPIHHQVFNQEIVKEQKGIMETVIAEGTGTAAQTGGPEEWGKTGTTEEEGDAWFCGGVASEVTACVWVGYPDTTTPMLTLYNGGPVMGGTYPAMIWARVITAWEEIKKQHLAERKAKERAKEEEENEGKSGSEAEEEIEAGEYEEPEYSAPEESYEYEEEAPVEEGVEEGATGGHETEGPVEEVEEPVEEAAPPVEEAAPPAEEAAPPAAAGGGVTAG